MDLGEDRDRAGREPVHRAPLGQPLPLDHHNVVYYIRKGDQLKIGHTHYLANRMTTLRPDALLAMEPGPTRLEFQRHRQFSAYGVPGKNEWYWPAPELLDFIRSLALLAPPPDLGRLLTPYSQLVDRCEYGHELIPENSIRSNKGGRACRVCHRARCLHALAQRRGEAFDLFAEANRHYARILKEHLP